MTYEKLRQAGEAERNRQSALQARVFSCASTACLAAGGEEAYQALDQAVDQSNENGRGAELVRTGCMGLCSRGPLVRVPDIMASPDSAWIRRSWPGRSTPGPSEPNPVAAA